tara:strand:+ start:287 stop:460 length:174 start_codon:yes stop_codon:yes gene_type:complete
MKFIKKTFTDVKFPKVKKEKGNIERYLEGDTKGMCQNEIGLIESYLKITSNLSKNLK